VFAESDSQGPVAILIKLVLRSRRAVTSGSGASRSPGLALEDRTSKAPGQEASGTMPASDRAHASRTSHPFRSAIVVVETLVGLGGLAGSIQLLVGAATPPVAVLSLFGLSSWTLPAGWLFLTVTLPSGLAAWLAWRRSPWAPGAVLAASALLITELLVQIPFVGFSVLQLIFAGVAAVMAVIALVARRAGWWPRRRRSDRCRSVRRRSVGGPTDGTHDLGAAPP
jgi:hypothetical protein